MRFAAAAALLLLAPLTFHSAHAHAKPLGTPVFRTVPVVENGRNASDKFAAWVRPHLEDGPAEPWTPALVMKTTAVNASSLGGCGYFSHLDGWTASWLTLEVAASVDILVRRLGGAAILTAAVHPKSSGASVAVNLTSGDAVVTVPAGSARFAVDFDGGLDSTDTGPAYAGPPVHTFSVFANELDPDPPQAGDPGVTAVAPGDPLPVSVPANTTLLLLPGEHRPAPAAAGGGPWPVSALPPTVRVHRALGAVLYAALNSGGAWGRPNVTVDGLGVLSGEEMWRCPNRTAAPQDSCDAACPVNISPQGISLDGVTRARVSGLTLVDFPNHHLALQATDCDAEGGSVAENLKVLGWRANGDGLHVFGTWQVRDLFLRTQDDSLYVLVRVQDDVCWWGSFVVRSSSRCLDIIAGPLFRS